MRAMPCEPVHPIAIAAAGSGLRRTTILSIYVREAGRVLRAMLHCASTGRQVPANLLEMVSRFLKENLAVSRFRRGELNPGSWSISDQGFGNNYTDN